MNAVLRVDLIYRATKACKGNIEFHGVVIHKQDGGARIPVSAFGARMPDSYSLPGSWHEGTFNKRFDRYNENINRYKQTMADGIRLVFQKYGQTDSVESAFYEVDEELLIRPPQEETK